MNLLRYRLGKAGRPLPDIGLVACLALLWVAGPVPLWVLLAYVCVAVAAYTQPSWTGTVVRVLVVAVDGAAGIIHAHPHGHVPTHDMVKLPVLATLALLFAGFARQRARAEHDLVLDQERLARVIDRIPLATIAFDKEARVMTWNSSAEELFGWKAEDVIGKPNPIVPVDQRNASNELFARIRDGERLQGAEVSRRARDGRALDLSLYSAPLAGEGTLVLYDDIRERKEAERERDQAESRFRDLVESVPLVTYVDRVDEHATNVYTSPQAVAMLGWPLDDWEADPRFFETILHPDDFERVMGQVHEANATRQEFDSEYRLRHQDGHYVWVRDRSAIFEDPAEPFARGFLLDITQEKQLEAQLLQAQKMDALGQFAGGIAHDFNNLLTGIAGYAELASPGAETNPELSRCLRGIKSAAAEAAGLTSSLLAFSRRNVPERKPVDVNAIVRETASALERRVRGDVRVILDLVHSVPPVAADRAQLKQVVLNLALNARDAMADGGVLTIETLLAAGNVILRVRDTGIGMDATTRSRALEPFFTTKPEGEGTGLGLSVVYGVVNSMGGRLWIDSAPGAGTTVELAFPAADAAAAAVERTEGAASVVSGTERVLVVDDRDVVRNLVGDVLLASGFDVIGAEGGREALDVFAAGESFDLLLTDVVMPEMSGPELAQQLRARQPGLPVLYMSGYTDDVLGPRELSEEATTFLRKPFGNAELVTAVREMLDGRPDGRLNDTNAPALG